MTQSQRWEVVTAGVLGILVQIPVQETLLAMVSVAAHSQ